MEIGQWHTCIDNNMYIYICMFIKIAKHQPINLSTYHMKTIACERILKTAETDSQLTLSLHKTYMNIAGVSLTSSYINLHHNFLLLKKNSVNKSIACGNSPCLIYSSIESNPKKILLNLSHFKLLTQLSVYPFS